MQFAPLDFDAFQRTPTSTGALDSTTTGAVWNMFSGTTPVVSSDSNIVIGSGYARITLPSTALSYKAHHLTGTKYAANTNGSVLMRVRFNNASNTVFAGATLRNASGRWIGARLVSATNDGSIALGVVGLDANRVLTGFTSATAQAANTGNASVGVWWWIRFTLSAAGAIKAKAWRDGTAEPASWLISTTAPSWMTTSAGTGGIFYGDSVGSASSRTVDIQTFYAGRLNEDATQWPTTIIPSWDADSDDTLPPFGGIPWAGAFSDDPDGYGTDSTRLGYTSGGIAFIAGIPQKTQYGYTASLVSVNGGVASGTGDGLVKAFFWVPDSSTFFGIGLRGTPTYTNGKLTMSGYGLMIGPTAMSLVKTPEMAVIASGPAPGYNTQLPINRTMLKAIFWLDGSTIRAKAWWGSVEPSWQIEVTNTLVTYAGGGSFVYPYLFTNSTGTSTANVAIGPFSYGSVYTASISSPISGTSSLITTSALPQFVGVPNGIGGTSNVGQLGATASTAVPPTMQGQSSLPSLSPIGSYLAGVAVSAGVGSLPTISPVGTYGLIPNAIGSAASLPTASSNAAYRDAQPVIAAAVVAQPTYTTTQVVTTAAIAGTSGFGQSVAYGSYLIAGQTAIGLSSFDRASFSVTKPGVPNAINSTSSVSQVSIKINTYEIGTETVNPVQASGALPTLFVTLPVRANPIVALSLLVIEELNAIQALSTVSTVGASVETSSLARVTGTSSITSPDWVLIAPIRSLSSMPVLAGVDFSLVSQINAVSSAVAAKMGLAIGTEIVNGVQGTSAVSQVAGVGGFVGQPDMVSSASSLNGLSPLGSYYVGPVNMATASGVLPIAQAYGKYLITPLAMTSQTAVPIPVTVSSVKPSSLDSSSTVAQITQATFTNKVQPIEGAATAANDDAKTKIYFTVTDNWIQFLGSSKAYVTTLTTQSVFAARGSANSGVSATMTAFGISGTAQIALSQFMPNTLIDAQQVNDNFSKISTLIGSQTSIDSFAVAKTLTIGSRKQGVISAISDSGIGLLEAGSMHLGFGVTEAGNGVVSPVLKDSSKFGWMSVGADGMASYWYEAVSNLSSPTPAFRVRTDQSIFIPKSMSVREQPVTTSSGANTNMNKTRGTATTTIVFAVGSIVKTTDALNVRSQPKLGDNVKLVADKGSRMTITGAPTRADGWTWYPVSYKGTAGFSAGEYLTLVSAPSTDTTTIPGALRSMFIPLNPVAIYSATDFNSSKGVTVDLPASCEKAGSVVVVASYTANRVSDPFVIRGVGRTDTTGLYFLADEPGKHVIRSSVLLGTERKIVLLSNKTISNLVVTLVGIWM